MPIILTRKYYKPNWQQSWSEYFYSFLPGRPSISYLISSAIAISSEDNQIKDFYLHLNDNILKVSLTPEEIEKILRVRTDQGYKFLIKIGENYLNYDPKHNCLITINSSFSEAQYLYYDQDVKDSLKEYYRRLTGKDYS